MPEVVLDQQKIHYIEQGKGDVLLLLPDNLHSSAAYNAEVQYYCTRFRVVSFDYQGTGHSARDAEYAPDERILDLWEHRSDLAIHLLIELGVRSCYVLGVGGGALSALHFAGYHARAHGFEAKGLVCDSFLSKMTSSVMHRMLNRREHYYVRQSAALRAEHGNDWREVADADTALLRSIADQGGYAVSDYLLKSIACPVLLTGSLGDPVTIGIAADFCHLSSLIPDCRLYLTTATEHPFMWKDASTFHKVVDLFFGQIGA